MLALCLDWRGRWLDVERNRRFPVSDRDVLALGLIALLSDAEVILVDEPDLTVALSQAFDGPEAPSISNTTLPDEADGRRAILLTTHERTDLHKARAGETLYLAYGLADGFKLAANGADLQIRVLSAINPCLWNSGLALVASPKCQDADRLMCERLKAVLGDQSLDPLPLYEETCRLQKQIQASSDAKRTLEASSRSRNVERDYFDLRHSIRSLIERASFSQRRLAARSDTGPVDWSSAFVPLASLSDETVQHVDQLGELEMRARRARTEAEFLREQLRARMPERNVDHHDLVSISGFFDVAWYSKTYNVPPAEAIRHYIDTGYRIGHDPSPIFSTSYYFETYPDVRALGFNPLVHYLMDGIYEGRSIDPPLVIQEDLWRDGFLDLESGLDKDF